MDCFYVIEAGNNLSLRKCLELHIIHPRPSETAVLSENKRQRSSNLASVPSEPERKRVWENHMKIPDT